MELWNIKDLKPPAVLSCKITTKEIDIRLLDVVLKNGVDFFEKQQHFLTEAALLSRTVYRLKMKFRNSKDFKSVEKLCRVLRVYLQLQMSKLLKNLSHCVPQNYKADRSYTLTKNMLDYVLVRVQGLGKILCRILETCKIVANLMQQRLRLGHFWKVALLVFASASRIFVITKSILKYVCEMYTNLLPFSSTLNNAGVQWLPEDYSFPARLDEWLNIDWLDLENDVIEIDDDDFTRSYFKLTDSDDDVEFCDEYILVKDETVMSEDTDQIEIDSSDEEEEAKEERKESDVGEVINISDVVFNNEVIEISDEPKKRKRKRKKSMNKNLGKNNIDIGEVINISEVTLDTTNTPRKPKRKKKNQNVNKSTQSPTKKSNAKIHKKRKQSGPKSAHIVGESRNNDGAQKRKKKRKMLHSKGSLNQSRRKMRKTL